jgi:hypothetical protein
MSELSEFLSIEDDFPFVFAVQLDGHLAILELYDGREIAVSRL